MANLDHQYQRRDVENPDQPPCHPEIVPTYSMEGYPVLPTVDLEGSLTEQVESYGELMLQMISRLRREHIEGENLLANIGMRRNEFIAQYREEFFHYDITRFEDSCVLPKTQMTYLYIEVVRIFIFLLHREGIHQANRVYRIRGHVQPSETESQIDANRPVDNPDADPNNAPSLEDQVDALSFPISSNVDSYTLELALTRLRIFASKLTTLDPATSDFLGRLQGLISTLESRYSSALESLDSTSGDASDLPEDSHHSNAGPAAGVAGQSGSSGSYQSCRVHSEASLQDIDNLPDDENLEREDRGEEEPNN